MFMRSILGYAPIASLCRCGGTAGDILGSINDSITQPIGEGAQHLVEDPVGWASNVGETAYNTVTAPVNAAADLITRSRT